MRQIIFIAAAVAVGCGGSPAPDPASPSTAGDKPVAVAPSAESTEPESPAEPEPAAPTEPPSVKVTGIMPPGEGKDYVRVQVVFENPNDQPCRIDGYTLSWGEYRKRLVTKNFIVPAKQSRERRTRVHPTDGKLDELTVESATTAIDGGCAD